MRWVTSDWHIGHLNICNFADRPWAKGDSEFEKSLSVIEMNAALVSNYYKVVGESDECIFVGDMVMGDVQDGLDLLALMPGRKTLVVGNHDKIFAKNKPEVRNKWYDAYAEVFDEILTHMEMSTGNHDVEVNHFTYVADKYDTSKRGQGDGKAVDRFADFRSPDEGKWLLHGHTHAHTWRSGPRSIHIGIDADWTRFGVERYHPIPIEAVDLAITNARLYRHDV